MPQSSAAKRHWQTFVRREANGESCFRFQKFPHLIEEIDRRVPTNGLVVMLGGGSGAVARFLGKRKYLNIEIADEPGPTVPTRKGDMEDQKQYVDLRRMSDKLSFLSPFSVEYTDVALTTSHIADTLKFGEVYVWVCHHSDSYILEAARESKQVLDSIVVPAGEALERKDRRKLMELAIKLEKVLHELFPDLGVSLVESDPRTFEHYAKTCWEYKHMAMSQGMLPIIFLRWLAETPTSFELAIERLNAIRTNIETDFEMRRSLLDLNLRSPEDLGRLVDTRLKLSSGVVIHDEETPLAIVGSFEKQ